MRIKDLIIYVLSFLICFLLFYNGNYASIYNNIFNSRVSAYKGTADIESKVELSLVFITSSTCGYSNDEDLPKIISQLKLKLAKRAKYENYNFSALGISSDVIVEDGLNHLKKFGFFDELIFGNGWSNLGILKYVYDDIKGVPVTPQILVTKRTYQTSGKKNSYHRIGLSQEIEVLRKVGLKKIKQWQKNGAPLPSDLRKL